MKEKLLKRKERVNSIILHCNYERRHSQIGRRIHQIWKDSFRDTPFEKKKIDCGYSKQLKFRQGINSKESIQ